MKKNTVYITAEVIENKEYSEIDILLQEEFGYNWDELDFEMYKIFNGKPDVINEPINIDLMIKTLQDLKEKGSTHISINYHEDHIGYEMTGYKLYHSTAGQIQSYKEKINK